MAELTALHTLTAQMKREGIRRLLVLSGKRVGVLIMRLSCVMPYLATGCGFRRSQMLKTTVHPRRYKLYLGASSGMRYSTPAKALMPLPLRHLAER